MNYIDIILGVLLLIFAVIGLKNGIIREVCSLIAFFAGIYGALHFADYVGGKIGEWLNINPDVLKIIAYVIVFIALVLLINLLGKILSKLVETISLGFIDKLGGIVFGLAKGFLIIGGFIMLMEFANMTSITQGPAAKNSPLYRISKNTAAYIYNYRDTIKKNIINGFEKTDEFVKEITKD